MTHITFTLATLADDAAIRALLARNPVPGRMTLTYLREPDYFAGCATMGPFFQVLVAKDGDRVVGLACRAVRDMFVNGTAIPVGYLGQLRIDASYRGRALVSRGFRMLRELHEDARTPAYVTTIIEGSSEANGVLVDKPRRGMPRYRFIEDLHTLAFAARAERTTQACRAMAHDRAELVAFINRFGATRQFFPRLDEADFGSDALHSLAVEDFLIVRAGGEVVAACGLWDQSAFKQTVVTGYSRTMAAARPLYDVAARLRGRPPLPAVGSRLRTLHASFLSGDDADAIVALLRAAATEARRRDFDWVVAGLTSRDDRLTVARRFRPVEYRSAVYTVQWNDSSDFHDRLDGRAAHLDPAML